MHAKYPKAKSYRNYQILFLSKSFCFFPCAEREIRQLLLCKLSFMVCLIVGMQYQGIPLYPKENLPKHPIASNFYRNWWGQID